VRRADRVAAVLLLAFGAGYALTAARSYTYWGAHGPGSGFFPFWLGLALAVLATLFLVGAVRQPEPGPAWLPDRRGALRFAVVVGTSALFIALVPVLGMTLTTALFLLGLLRLLEGHRWAIALGVAIATAAVNWAIFTWWLSVPFPTGPLGF
jgi:putative tricarboxylic transport membrane protein